MAAATKEDKQAPDPWWLALSKLALPAAIAAVVTFAGTWFTFTNASRELDLKMVDVSLAILSGERGGVDTTVDDAKVFAEYRLARLFALRALEKYSGVSIPDPEKVEWAESGKIAFGEVPVSQSYWNNYTPKRKMVPEAIKPGGNGTCPQGYLLKEPGVLSWCAPVDIPIANPDVECPEGYLMMPGGQYGRCVIPGIAAGLPPP